MSSKVRKSSVADVMKKNFHGRQRTTSEVQGVVTMKGFLQKKSTGLISTWQRRFFVIASHYLKYYDNESMKEYKGLVDLKHVALVTITGTNDDANLTITLKDNRALTLKVNSMSDAKKWKKGIEEFDESEDPGAENLPLYENLDDDSRVQDTVVSLEPYFTINEGKVDEFKKIWSDAYADTQANADVEKSVWYGFSFDGQNAHCREAYGDAAGVLKHLENVDAPLKACLEVAKLERLVVHGPVAEVDKLRESLTPLGCEFYNLEWGFQQTGDPFPMDEDSVVNLKPWFKMHDGKLDEFKAIWKSAYTKSEPGCVYYGFSFDGDKAHCREGYRDAAAVLSHLELVDAPLKKAMTVADLVGLEVHGPAAEVAKLKETLSPLGCKFYDLQWGFRRGTDNYAITVAPHAASIASMAETVPVPSAGEKGAKRGTMKKQGSTFPTWKQRYFDLDTEKGVLYYRSKQTGAPLGAINIKGATIISTGSATDFKIVAKTRGEGTRDALPLSCANEAEAKEWVRVLKEHA